MYSLTLTLLIVLAGILFWRWYTRNNKLPPGPLPLPIIGSLHLLLGKYPHRVIHKLSEKYGSIMSIRLGSVQFVILSSPDAAKLFLGKHDAIFASRPITQSSECISYGSKGVTFTQYGPYWRSAKKFCKSELLTTAKINSFAGMRMEEIELMIKDLKSASESRKILNLSKNIGVVVENMTLRMIFGKKSDDKFTFSAVLDKAMETVGKFNLGDYLPILAPFDIQGLNKRLKSLSKDIDDIFEIVIDEHEKRGPTVAKYQSVDQMDFIDTIMSLTHEDSNSTHAELSSRIDRSSMKAILLDIVAGSIDTTKTSILWILSALFKNPRVLNELQNELKNVVGDKQVVEEEDLKKLTYLHMVVKETFRRYPAAPLLFPHESMEDIVINGYFIPKKTRVLINYWGFGRHTKVWSENWEEFLPERFLNSEINIGGPDFKLIQFGAGRRGCPGMNLALLNIYLVVSNMVHCFNWELPHGMSPNDLDMNEQFGLTTPRVKPLLAIATCRI